MVESEAEIVEIAEQTGHDPDAFDLELLMGVSKYQLYETFSKYGTRNLAQKGALLGFNGPPAVLIVALSPELWDVENPHIQVYDSVIRNKTVFKLQSLHGWVFVDKYGNELDLIDLSSDSNPFYSINNNIRFIDRGYISDRGRNRKITIVLPDSTQISFKILDDNIYERLDDNDITPHELSGHVKEIIDGAVRNSLNPNGFVQLQCDGSDKFFEFLNRDDYSDIENEEPVVIAYWTNNNTKVYAHTEDINSIAYVKEHFHEVTEYHLV